MSVVFFIYGMVKVVVSRDSKDKLNLSYYVIFPRNLDEDFRHTRTYDFLLSIYT